MSFGADGFLGTRASLMLDVVVLAMLVVVPALALSVYLVMFRRQYTWHKRIQLVLGMALLVTVVAFEADMRIGGWRHRAEPSPYSGAGRDRLDFDRAGHTSLLRDHGGAVVDRGDRARARQFSRARDAFGA